jgi:peptide/nickel transport system ATP-binding protein
MTATALLSVRDLRVVFDGRRGALTALDGISFDMTPGEILGMVGESGAGKSLTGTAIIGLLDPPGRIASGSIFFDGNRIDNLPQDRIRPLRGRHIGAIFQDPLTSLHPLFSVGDQLIETILTHLPISRADARSRAIQLLADVGIPAPDIRIEQHPHQFSGGMRQRVVIALALCAGPRLIIADEPTTALDVSIQAQITTLLKRLCRDQGTAVMLITHDMGVIAETADRVAVMYAGRIVEIGPVDQVVRTPRHPYTAGLMASIPSVHKRRIELQQIDGTMPRLDAIPSGCPFNPRCGRAVDQCRSRAPALAADVSHAAACHRPLIEADHV